MEVITDIMPAPKLFDPKELVAAVEQEMWLEHNSIRGPRRHREVVLGRLAVIYILRKRGWTFPQIGRFLNRDHTTVLDLHRKADVYCRAYPILPRTLRSLEEYCR